jgi:hypothetical protein
MMRLLRATALGLAALTLPACATTNLAQVWRDPKYRPAPALLLGALVLGVLMPRGPAAERLAVERLAA